MKQLMDARRTVSITRRQGDRTGEDQAHAAVDAAKRALGERGPVWWNDGGPDLNRHMARNSPYKDWFAALGCDAAAEPKASKRPAADRS